MGYDDPATDAYYDRKLAERIKWQAMQAERKKYYKVAKELWDAYYALLKEAKLEEKKGKDGEKVIKLHTIFQNTPK